MAFTFGFVSHRIVAWHGRQYQLLTLSHRQHEGGLSAGIVGHDLSPVLVCYRDRFYSAVAVHSN